MLKKGWSIIWQKELVDAFLDIKETLKNTPVLVKPDYGKPFHLFSFASFYTIVVVLLQKNKDGFEKPIGFFSKSL